MKKEVQKVNYHFITITAQITRGMFCSIVMGKRFHDVQGIQRTFVLGQIEREFTRKGKFKALSNKCAAEL